MNDITKQIVVHRVICSLKHAHSSRKSWSEYIHPSRCYHSGFFFQDDLKITLRTCNTRVLENTRTIIIVEQQRAWQILFARVSNIFIYTRVPMFSNNCTRSHLFGRKIVTI